MKRLVLSLFAAALLPAAVLAQSSTTFPGDIPDNLRFRFGGLYAHTNSTVDFSTPTLPSEPIDLSGLSPNHKFTFHGEGSWNFAGRSFLDFGAASIATNKTASISQNIDFGGVIYTAGAQVTADSLARTFYAGYRYGFIKNPDFQLGLSLGLSYITLREQLSASAGVTLPGGTPVGGTVTKEAEINLPVPILGLEAEAKIVDGVSLGARVRAMGATISPYSGNVIDATAHADWYIIPNFGVGAGYQWSRFDVKKTQDTKTLSFKFHYDGPRVYAIVSF
jgi:hypothetical protein